MDFGKEIIELDKDDNSELVYVKNGSNKVLLTSVHRMIEFKENENIKMNEPFIKGIAKYVSNKTNSYCMVKNYDDGCDTETSDEDEFKNKLAECIKENDIKLVLDIHGASILRDFDVELGTLNNISADFSTIKELKEAFEEVGILNVYLNDPSKGDKITQYLYMTSDIDVIQVEVNRRFRDIDDPEKIKRVCDSIIKFINQYTMIINGDIL